MLKEVTEKYSRELDGFIRELRKKLSRSEAAEDAERLLNDEFAAVLEISPHEVPDYIRSKMQLEA